MDGRRFDRAARLLARSGTRRGVVAAAIARLSPVRGGEAQGVCTWTGGLCPIGCSWGGSCAGCCGGRCSATGYCTDVGCMGSGCSCTVGLSFQCGYGLTCCSLTGAAYSTGTCQYACYTGV